ncbi:unnamed protein product [Hydatigera taeniaeformis]|uniref:Retrotransposon gag domain-containing protein n=1 Tax=Hydatigena taeniaeformis TaxID=6205 RepID=A0A0R3X3B3_HYDTA|nr:unnamed protein product [Hydatigera taeniaeformis]
MQETVSLPQFWTNDVIGWFRQAEAQFRLGGVRNEMERFNAVWSRLPPDISRLCHQLYLKRESEPSPYETLKAEVLRVTNVVEDDEKIEDGSRPGIRREERSSSLLRTGLQKAFYQ